MVITKIEKDNKKYRVYGDEQYLFCLYYTEIKRYDLRVEDEISDELLDRIGNEVILKRGLAYVYHLLSKKDYTQGEILKKLLQAGYLESFAGGVIDRVKAQGFINDLDYAKRYIDQTHTRKSKRQIIYTLQGKGITQEILTSLYEGSEISEYEAAFKLAKKKIKNSDQLTYEERAKVYTYMANKGFSSSTIHRVIEDVMALLSDL